MVDKLLLEVKDLVAHHETGDGVVKALNGINMHIGVGEALEPVGETGMGGTTLAKGIMRLTSNPSGKILGGEMVFEGQDLLKLSANGMGAIRDRDISMVPQGPMASLNPVFTIGKQIMEVIENHNANLSRQGAREWTENMLERVGIPAERFGEYPHQFSGDMRQRMVIVIALACNPRLLIADEPTTALDVTMQTRMLEMIYKLKSEDDTSMILITHDLGVVAQDCDYVAIIYAERVAEYGTLREIYKDMRYPYTEGLSGSIPSLTSDAKRLWAIDGVMPDSTRLPKGCVPCGRCKHAVLERSKDHPGMVTVDETHQVRCIRYR